MPAILGSCSGSGSWHYGLPVWRAAPVLQVTGPTVQYAASRARVRKAPDQAVPPRGVCGYALCPDLPVRTVCAVVAASRPRAHFD
eukprot:3111840-Pyramimonas_sp.AAC.1